MSIVDAAYKKDAVSRDVAASGSASVVLRLDQSHGWYDFRVMIKGFDQFEKRYAGRVETGKDSVSDPFMGRVV